MNANVGEIRELKSLPDFETVIATGTGFLVVTDRSTPTHVHRAKCPAVQQGPVWIEASTVGREFPVK